MQLEAAKLRADREARGLREKELAHQLQLKQLELEEHDRERQLHLKQMELEERDRERQFERERQERDLELKRLELELASKSVLSVESQTPVFDVSRHIRLVPPFSEDEKRTVKDSGSLGRVSKLRMWSLPERKKLCLTGGVFPVRFVQSRSAPRTAYAGNRFYSWERFGWRESSSPSGAPSDGGVVEGAPRTRAVNVHGDETMSLPVSKTLISQEQRKDSTLTQCRSAVVDKANITANSVAFFWDKGILMRKWNPPTADDVGWNSVYQVVVPLKFRSQVLCLGHDNVMSGHLGVTKTYNRILRHFFWPGLKSDVAQYCRSCHVCQLAGKPNQSIPPAPLCPVPVLTEPFSKIILDCVGPLPRTKTGFKYLLTIMCSATRFPEAVPLRSLKAKNIVRALVTFFSTFGLPKLVQTDQGSNFLSRLFKQVLEELQIKHLVSSAYHPQSQGALERFHQTLKSMLRTYCLASAKEWDEGLPLLLVAIRETVQESLGFSPADLVFGHTVRGPLKLLKEAWVAEPLTETNVLDHVSSFRERLHNACATARASLQHAQGSMKARYDQKAVSRSFQPGDRVLVLLPLMGSALQAKFSGPYVVESQLSDTDYVVRTPDRKRKMRVCHVNMLKKYVMRDSDATQDNVDPPGKGAAVLSVASMPLLDAYSPEEDGLYLGNVPVSSPRLHNSVILQNLDAHLSHLPLNEREQVMILIRTYKTLFGDVPSCTTVLKHDIDVGEHAPIRQHPYRLNPTKRTVMQSEVDYLLEHGFSVPSCSPWSSPCLLVPKPDGTVRFCTDYRKVNAVTRPDSFPLPRMEDYVDRTGDVTHVGTKTYLT
ncbi:uncharacterized protein LOC114796860 [Denticeps clupeoides]|uniref:uncharacterized protein LOC114796860 n=1 Tax=Denticeps clupeoides TaxID=299321 RepID=UPI0010A33C1F|nr:uncharacterized protein LOC114796860 [Denticeps clupeoides]